MTAPGSGPKGPQPCVSGVAGGGIDVRELTRPGPAHLAWKILLSRRRGRPADNLRAALRCSTAGTTRPSDERACAALFAGRPGPRQALIRFPVDHVAMPEAISPNTLIEKGFLDGRQTRLRPWGRISDASRLSLTNGKFRKVIWGAAGYRID